MFSDDGEDPMFREHLDDMFFDPDCKTHDSSDYTKKLICQYLMRLIQNEEKIVETKLTFFNLLAKKDVTHLQLFQRLDQANKGYLTYSDFIDFAKVHKIPNMVNFTPAKLKYIFKNKKTTFELFVRSLLDIESLKKDEFAPSYLSNAQIPVSQHSPIETFLATFENQGSKFIRKIDVLNPHVETQFLSFVQEIIEIKSHEEFEKKQIKVQTETAVKDVYLEILSMSGF